MPVSSIKKELKKVIPHYDIIRDCVAGEIAIKSRSDKYLPRPNSSDTSVENQSRYDAYLTRAVFYNVVQRTLGGMVGQIFARDPIIEIPSELDVVKNDATGFGVRLVQLAKAASSLVVAYGRAGLLADYPVTDSPATKAQIDSGDIRPTITLFEPWNVINWRTIKRGGREILSMVVLKETYIKTDDGFEETEGTQWRVLELNAFGEYFVTIWRDTQPISRVQMFTPKDSNGNAITEIPFTFIGSEDNDPTVDNPPLYDLASLNIGHYRNSADYEESCYIVGQPTPYFTGLTENWVKEILKGEVQLGARAAVPLPAGSTAGLLQASENSMPFEAMQHKERQMVALGAKLVEQQSVQRTATEAGLEHSDETSVLSASADNVSDAVTFSLRWCGVFIGIETAAGVQDDAGVKTPFQFDLNTEFDLLKLAPDERQQLITEWQADAISWSEMRANMLRGGIATLDAEKAKEEIKKNPSPKPAVAAPGGTPAKPGVKQKPGAPKPGGPKPKVTAGA